jgi:hypothetical protein
MDYPKDEETVVNYDIAVRSMLLPGILDNQLIINFLNKYHQTTSGNFTLLTDDNFTSLAKLGTLCSYIMREDLDENKVRKNGDLIGNLFSTLITISITGKVVRFTYSSYLCVAKEYRKKNYSRFLVDATERYLKTMLKTDYSYFLSYKNWGHGMKIQSYYRVLDYQKMKDAGFGVIKGSKKKMFYHIKKVVGCIITEGIDINLTCRDFEIYWCPTESEQSRYAETLNFRTVQYQQQKMTFCLFPLSCLVAKTGQTVKIAMLSYFYITDPSLSDLFFKIVLQIAKQDGYDCLYGYLIGDINEQLMIDNSCHITDMKCYLNFFNINISNAKLERFNLFFY